MTPAISPRFIEFSKPFIDAAKNIFETMVFTKIETGKPEIKSEKESRGDVSSVIGITGSVERNGASSDFKGQFVITFPADTYVKVASAMLMEEHKDLGPAIIDVGSEICNMIMGNAKRDLATLGYKIAMSIPTTITGKGHSITYPAGVIIVLVPMNCSHGTFYFEICYQDK